MKFLPQSLLWRAMLLLALLLVAGNFAWLQIFRVSEREPRAAQVALQIASIVNLTRAALITANPAKRFDLLRDLSEQEGIQVYADAPNEPVEPLPDRPFARLLIAEIQRRLGADTRIQQSVGAGRNVWINFDIDDIDYWVRMPRERVERAEQLRWIGWGLLVLLLSVAGAYLIVMRVSRSLRELTGAAAAIGRGQTPEPVNESGPSEVRTLSRAFNQMSADLKRQDEDRALLLAGVSHDLRTPLARIRLGLEMLDSKTDPSLMEGMVQDIADIDAVITQFLDFARISGEQNAATNCNIGEIVDSVAQRFRKQGVEIVTHCSVVPDIQLNPLAIQRLLTNLIENARRHGGPDVDVGLSIVDDRLRLSVMDRGPGIPADEAERMLQPFTRLNAARSTSGSGLGLAIVDRIARMHHGRVQLLPRDGGGLEARVEFPLR
jgi:two-component system osmolarity sensor histidine kinase EnvZ